MNKFKEHLILASSTAVFVSLLLIGVASAFGVMHQYQTMVQHVARIDRNLTAITKFLVKKYPHLVDELRFK